MLVLVFPFNLQAGTIDQIVAGAYAEINNETQYITEMLEKYFPPTYQNGKNTGRSVYPNGDVNPNEGICADLIVRALRKAGIDLQKAVHLDVLHNKKTYGVRTPDKFIDHRRVWILKTFFKRKWANLSTEISEEVTGNPGMLLFGISDRKSICTLELSAKRNAVTACLT